MMQKVNKKILPLLVSTVAIVALAISPALAKDSKNKKSSHSSARTATEAAGHVPEENNAPKAGHHDSRPGPAWRTLGGTVKKIEGNAYTVEDYEGNHVKLYVGQGTKHIKQKKVGDTVRAEITRGGFANSIQ
jgi:ribosomal protein L21E